jgi:polygalacturonase
MSLTKASYSLIQGAVYNVLDFGADSTGATLSQTAIQAALDAVKATGGDLFFPAGTYDVGSGVEIIGTRRFRLFGTKNTVLKLTSVGIALKIQNCRDFVVELFKFETTNGVGSTALRTQWNPSLTTGGIYSTTNYVVREVIVEGGDTTTNSFDTGIHISGLDGASRQNSEMLLEKIGTQTNLRGFLVDGGNTANITAISCTSQQSISVATTNYGWYLD